jgi:hypothetical protein
MLSTYGFRLADGRGIWQARWRYGDSGDTVQVVLMQDGRLFFDATTTPARATDLLMTAMDLPEAWLDSIDIATIVASLPVPEGFVGSSLGSMTLRSFNDHPHLWEILNAADRNGTGQLASTEHFASWAIYIDAVSGAVLAEVLGRKVDYQIVPARIRQGGGDWVDLVHSG